MKKANYLITNKFRICIVLVLQLICLGFAKASGYHVITHTEIAKGVKLDGIWEFYWQTDYAESNLLADKVKPTLVNMPSQWCEIGYPPKGFGVFKTKIILPAQTRTAIALSIPSVANAYNLYINGTIQHSVGQFGKTDTQSTPEYLPSVVTYTPLSDTLEIAFEVSNYSYREGGMCYSIRIGEAKSELKKFNAGLFITAFFTGTLLLMSIYFGFIFLIRRTEKASLFFALLCLAAAIRVATTDGILLRQIDLPIDWSILVKLELSSIILIPTFGTLFLFHLIAETKHKTLLKIFNLISFGMLTYIIFTPTYYASYVVPPFRYFALLQILFVFYVITVNLFNHNNLLSKLAAAGYYLIFVLGINDILYSKGVIDSFYLLPFGIFGFVIIHAVLLAQRFANSYTEVEILSQSLTDLNKNQELIIESRTRELAQKTLDLEKYNAIKDKIFAIIAHDLKAPIASFRSVITLAEIGDNNDISEIRRFFNSLKPNIDNLTLTIDNLLMWSQSQLNGTTINPTHFNLVDKVNKVLGLYKLVADQKSISLVIEIAPELTIYADKAHVEIILRNLINNAIKFTTTGGTVKVAAKPVAKNLILIDVIDNGVGIETEKLHLMFDENVHYTSYGTRNESGTGLGLKMCKAFIEQNGGSIHISSQLNIGTKIGFTLPKGQD